MKKAVKHKVSLAGDGFDFISYKDKDIKTEVFRDGSGYLNVDSINIHLSDGTHRDRIRELERIARETNKALKILNQIGDPKIYFPVILK